MQQAVLRFIPFIWRINCKVIVEPSKNLLTSKSNFINIITLAVNIIIISIYLRIVTFASSIIITDSVIRHNSGNWRWKRSSPALSKLRNSHVSSCTIFHINANTIVIFQKQNLYIFNKTKETFHQLIELIISKYKIILYHVCSRRVLIGIFFILPILLRSLHP